MTRGDTLNWLVPREEWDAFVEFVEEKWGDAAWYAGREVDAAMREWIDADGGNATEEKLRRVIEAAGRTPEPHTQKKYGSGSDSDPGSGSRDALANQEKTRVSCRVHPSTKREFKAFSDENSDDYAGVELGRALRQYREADRLDRIEEKLDRVVDDVEAVMDLLADDEDQLTGRQKKVVQICHQLDADNDRNLHQDMLREVIANTAGDSVIDDYVPKVLNRLDFVQHPNVAELYIHESRLADLGVNLDAPAIDRKPYGALDRSERLDGIAIELARAAAARSGTAAMTVKQVHREIFDGNGSANYVRQLMDDVADRPGYEWRTPRGDRSKRLKVVLSKVDEEILETLRRDRDRDRDRDQSTDGGATSPAVADGGWLP